MYVLVDRESMVFRHAHPDHTVLSQLAHIEVAHVATYIFPVDEVRDFLSFTDLEMKLLYQNTTGQKYEGYSRSHLNDLVLEAARRLPVSDVKPFEVQQQANKIPMDDSGFYRYAKGAFKAARLQELFTPEALTVTPGSVAQQPAPGPDRTSAAATVPPAPPAAPKGGARAVIWSVADKMWEDAGKPTNSATVLALRKTIMAELEQNHGVKKTTSSTALGEWQKVRLNA